ncbi:MAG: trypsin-like peptidase domain-containing protein, partial [Bacteroidia bacterium]|nr:trypsin-like peptidase domain-containing protein [Bacteroidia bacterium]
MWNKLISLTLAVAILLLTNGCASVLNGRTQTVMVKTGASDAVVYVNDQRQGSGSMVRTRMARDFNPKQIKVERPGYKPEYAVHRQTKKSWLYIVSWIPFGVFYLLPPLLDRGPKAYNYTSETGLSTHRKVNSKASDQKYMVLKNVNFDVKGEDFIIEKIDFKRFKKGKSSKSGDQTNLNEDIKVDNSIFSNALNAALFETGFIDTSGSILKSRTNNTYVNARVSKMKFITITSYKGYYNRSLICETTIDWEFMDKYSQVKVKKTSTAKSGEFCEYANVLSSKNDEDKLNVIQRAVQDAITNSFYEVIDQSATREWLKVSSDSAGMVRYEPLQIQRGNVARDMKSSIEATTVILTDKGHGSGCVVGTEGYVVTSFHVIAGVDSAIKVAFKDGDTAIATVIRSSEYADLALLKVKKTCKFAFMVSQKPDFEVADEVFAIGTPASVELGQTVSKGIVSGLRKEDAG